MKSRTCLPYRTYLLTLPVGLTVAVGGSVGWDGTGSVSNTLPQLSVGASTSLTLRVHVDSALLGTLTNTAVVTSATLDPVPTDNAASAETLITPRADLSLVKIGPAEVIAGSNMVYTLSVSNAGPSLARSVVLMDTLPVGLTVAVGGSAGWDGLGSVSNTVPQLSVGASTSLTLRVHVDSALLGTLTNTAVVTSATLDPVPTDNASSAETLITPRADLSLLKIGPAEVIAGSNMVYTLSVSNAGPSVARSVVLTDTLPVGLTVAVGGSVGWDGTGSVSNTLPQLSVGASTSLTLRVHVHSGLLGTLTNTAVVTSATLDPVPTDNASSAETLIAPRADLSLVKIGPAEVIAGSNMVYTLSVSNAGPSLARSVVLMDTLPVGLTVAVGGSAGWDGTGSVSNTVPQLSVGASTSLTLRVHVDSALLGTLTNTAVVTSATLDPVPTDNTSSAETLITPRADLSLLKSGPAEVIAGSNMVYTLSVSNAGPSLARSVVLTDTLPVGLTVAAGGSAGWDGTGSVSNTVPQLSVGASTSLTLRVHVDRALAGTVTNTAVVTSTTLDPVPLDNASSAGTVVLADSDGDGEPDSLDLDDDDDGMPDSFEQRYGFDPLDATDASSNADWDVYLNWQEYVADTDPTNGDSFFHAQNIGFSNGFIIRFESSSQRFYTLQYAVDLSATGGWMNVPGLETMQGTGGPQEFTNWPDSSIRFYRLGVGLEGSSP